MINVLTKEVYNRISAGEVIERPSSIVKELFENSIDAGADEIVVSIEGGGIDEIFVMDNGCGIEKDDLTKVFLPHATSKLKTAEDLENIRTLGFRGEAMPSIASVSRCSISSTTDNDVMGYNLVVEGGEFGEIVPAPCKKGTAVTVKDLFYNTPARLKFLKSDRAEQNDVTDLIEKLILSNPNVAVKYSIGDENVIYQSYGGGFKEAVLTVYGADTVKKCYEISTEKNGIKIEGFIGNTNFFKSNRTYQTIIVNGRWITDNTIATAVHNAYANYLMKRQYPFYVLSLTIDPQFVDVNVSPRKTEVRFQDNHTVYGAVYSTISKVLDGSADALNIVVTEPASNTVTEITDFSRVTSNDEPALPSDGEFKPLPPKPSFGIEYPTPTRSNYDHITDYEIPKPILPQTRVAQSASVDSTPVSDLSTPSAIDDIFKENKAYIEKLERERRQKLDGEQQSMPNDAPVKVIGQALTTYLVLECGEEMIIIDQHAAHERILYDKFCRKVKEKEILKQDMLIPYAFRVNAKESDLLFDRIDYFRDLGIDLESVDDSTFKVYAIPVDLVDINLDLFFSDILNDSKFKEETIPTIIREKLMQKACKSAIKSGDSLSQSEINSLLALLKQDWGLKCPHGRPVCVKISRTEIDKWFKRIV